MAQDIKTPATAVDQPAQQAEATPAVGKLNIAGKPYGVDSVLDLATELFNQAHAQDNAGTSATKVTTTSDAESGLGTEDQPGQAEAAPTEMAVHPDAA